MQRTTIKLSDDLDCRLRHEAQRQGVTISEVSRTAIALYLGSQSGRLVGEEPTGGARSEAEVGLASSAEGAPKRRTFLAAGVGASGHGSIAEQIEDIIRNEVHQSH